MDGFARKGRSFRNAWGLDRQQVALIVPNLEPNEMALASEKKRWDSPSLPTK
jgi:hypothetical protein